MGIVVASRAVDRFFSRFNGSEIQPGGRGCHRCCYRLVLLAAENATKRGR